MTTATTSRRNSNFFILSFPWKEKMPKEILMRITAPVLHYFVELLFQLLLHYSQEEKTVCHHKCRYRCHCYYWYHCGDISKAVFVAFPRMYIVKNYSLMFLVVGQKWSQAISKHQKFHHEWQEKVLQTVVMMVAKIFISFLSQRIITFVCLFLPLHCFFFSLFYHPSLIYCTSMCVMCIVYSFTCRTIVLLAREHVALRMSFPMLRVLSLSVCLWLSSIHGRCAILPDPALLMSAAAAATVAANGNPACGYAVLCCACVLFSHSNARCLSLSCAAICVCVRVCA